MTFSICLLSSLGMQTLYRTCGVQLKSRLTYTGQILGLFSLKLTMRPIFHSLKKPKNWVPPDFYWNSVLLCLIELERVQSSSSSVAISRIFSLAVSVACLLLLDSSACWIPSVNCKVPFSAATSPLISSRHTKLSLSMWWPLCSRVTHLYDYRPNWTPLNPISIINLGPWLWNPPFSLYMCQCVCNSQVHYLLVHMGDKFLAKQSSINVYSVVTGNPSMMWCALATWSV